MIVGDTYLTLADKYKRSQSDGQIGTILELLAQSNPVLEDMLTVECNDGSTHLTTMRTGLPTATFRKLYEGIVPSKSTTMQVRDGVGMAEAWSEVDKKLVDMSRNPAQVRLSESTAFLEAMNNAVAQRIFYGDNVHNPAEFLGLAPRFNDLSAGNGGQIVDAGGQGSENTSLWMVVWGERTLHALYPQGSKAGLSREDKGVQTTKDLNGGLYDVYREKYSWDIGLSVRDWRYVVRIANIDVNEARKGKVPLYDYLRQAYYKLHQRTVMGGRPAIYCNVDILETLDALATNAGANDNFIRLKNTEVEGKEIHTYRGIPVRQCDSLMNTEARVKWGAI
jgi:hypothetical protein